MMDIKIYTSPGCFYCDQMKELCKRAEVSYEAIMIDQDISRQDFLKLHPDVEGFPYVIIDGEVIGGLVESAKYFLKKGLVSANKG